MSRVLRGIWLELRVIPVLLWSASALTLGTALGARGSDLDVAAYLGAVTLGLLIQGLLAHCVNEIEDWRSGTDRHASPRVISGGSKVLAGGLLTVREMTALFWVALTITTVLGLSMVAAHGAALLPFGLLGVVGAIAYTQPPLRAAYRPFIGEAVAFGCLMLCVPGAAVLQGGDVDAVTLLCSVAVSGYAVAMLMVHHYLDLEADRTADPPKRTTIVLLGLDRGRRYATAWCLVALVAAAAASAIEPLLLPLPLAYCLGLAAHLRCRPHDVVSVTKCEMAIIFSGIGGAMGAAALVEPPLALMLLVAAAVIAVEMRLAAPPPQERVA
jgi:1,4-dihydroxy-2-naphthoate octaprenyltransferase